MQFQGCKKEVFRILLSWYRKTIGWNRSIIRVHFLQQNLLQFVQIICFTQAD
jgi:hypothetical protein